MVVVVPAHDEAQLLPACLRSLRVAAAAVPVPVEVVVVLDSCTDASAEAVRTGAPGARVVHVHRRNVGAARAAGFAGAVDAGTWCASTDADTVVAPDWLAVQLRHAADGADMVAGTVRVGSWAGHPAGLRAAFDARYTQADGHRHVHGANLGVRGSAYLTLGGFASSAVHEDVDLVGRAEAAGYAVRWSADVVVQTSVRTAGRAPGGFAAHLRTLAANL